MHVDCPENLCVIIQGIDLLPLMKMKLKGDKRMKVTTSALLTRNAMSDNC